MKNKVLDLMLNPEKYMSEYMSGLGYSSNKNGYISEEARKKARAKRKKKKNKK